MYSVCIQGVCIYVPLFARPKPACCHLHVCIKFKVDTTNIDYGRNIRHHTGKDKDLLFQVIGVKNVLGKAGFSTGSALYVWDWFQVG